MAKLSVRVDGLTEARANVANLPPAFRAVVVRTLYFGSGIIGIEASRRVPVDKGKLAASRGRNIREDGLQIAVGFGDKKAKFLEFGTNDTRAQPFLLPGFRIGARYIRQKMRGWAKEARDMAIQGNVNAGVSSLDLGGVTVRSKINRRPKKASP